MFSLDFIVLSNDCLNGRPLQATDISHCETIKHSINVQKIRQGGQTYYCIGYEKKTDNISDFNILSFDLHKDYELKYVSTIFIDCIY